MREMRASWVVVVVVNEKKKMEKRQNQLTRVKSQQQPYFASSSFPHHHHHRHHHRRRLLSVYVCARSRRLRRDIDYFFREGKALPLSLAHSGARSLSLTLLSFTQTRLWSIRERKKRMISRLNHLRAKDEK